MAPSVLFYSYIVISIVSQLTVSVPVVTSGHQIGGTGGVIAASRQCIAEFVSQGSVQPAEATRAWLGLQLIRTTGRLGVPLGQYCRPDREKRKKGQIFA